MDADLIPLPYDPPPLLDDTLLPTLFSGAGEQARYRFVEYFTARIRNPNTRQAYFRAVNRFSQWCTLRNLDLTRLNPVVIAGYIEELQQVLGVTSVKQHLSAIRMLFDYLVTGHVVPFNPAQAVQAPRYSASEGKTPILSAQETRM
ncbi:MAG TPA: site-specific integrase, partial [Caldilineaceae bacterium]|nr:site-specific integrase [Caldilineaceae bacterium]